MPKRTPQGQFGAPQEPAADSVSGGDEPTPGRAEGPDPGQEGTERSAAAERGEAQYSQTRYEGKGGIFPLTPANGLLSDIFLLLNLQFCLLGSIPFFCSLFSCPQLEADLLKDFVVTQWKKMQLSEDTQVKELAASSPPPQAATLVFQP